MKTKKQIEVAATKAHVRTQLIVTCDLCGKEVDRNRSCCICKRDLCNSCAWDDPHDGGDYPSRYCRICYDLKFLRFGDRKRTLDEAHWDAEEQLDKEVKEQSLKETCEAAA